GADISISLDISFMEACKGIKHEIEINRSETCDSCNGSGAKAGTTAKTCPECNGAGQVRFQQRTILGSMMSTRPCTKCGGKGKVIETPCPTCHGGGRVQKKKKITVNVPAGIDDGQILRVGGEGNVGTNGGSRGDLNVRISVRRDPLFERKGFDVWTEIPITYAQAVLGAEVTVPTVDGNINFKVPEGTQPDTVFRLKGKGIKKLQRDGRGDQMVKVILEVPKNLSKKQKEALEEFSQMLTDKNYEKQSGFFDRLKKFGEDLKKNWDNLGN
ncbi:MAG: molecular chaperone DnaJ, partial [Ruminiclostridium sp.]|nr:molecular chaperone DnaJ [Ruminiclostridium sp.]